MDKLDYKVAYLSMEIGLEDRVRSYAGGLGVLAGDILKSAADLGYPMVGVTMLSDKGYFDQEIIDGRQVSFPESDYDFTGLKKLSDTISVEIGSEMVEVGAWEYLIKGIGGGIVPVYFLDTSRPANSAQNRLITSFLYGGDIDYRLRQEIVLGIGGIKLLEKLGYDPKKFHLNEGHNSLAAAYLLSQSKASTWEKGVAAIKEKIVFTNHTPIRAGNDSFRLEDMVAHCPSLKDILVHFADPQDRVDMTFMGMSLSGFISGVSRPHQRILRQMYPDFRIASINNGINANYWTNPALATVFDHYLGRWREDNSRLKEVRHIPLAELASAHALAKRSLISRIEEVTGIELSETAFTIGFARRFAPYKRSAMLLSDMDHLLRIHKNFPLQIIYSGKAHPRDDSGQDIIAEILEKAEKHQAEIRIIFLEDYDLSLSRLMAAGCDLWLNNPLPYLEASGTSGMKAAVNGVPQLSTKDGWWVDGYRRRKTGWAFGRARVSSESAADPLYQKSIQVDAPELYDTLEKKILPMFYRHPKKWQRLMRLVIAINGCRFSSQNTVKDYIKQAYDS